MTNRLERIINERGIQELREKYFPLIRDRVITGYNLYDNITKDTNLIQLSYFHSDLKTYDRHSHELFNILEKEINLEEKIIISNRLIDRSKVLERLTNYRTKTQWLDPKKKKRYFTLMGRELAFNEAKKLRDVIEESIQYELSIRITNKEELRKIIDLLKKYTSIFKLDRKGKKIKNNDEFIKNDLAIYEAWDIPLLVCRTSNNKKPSNLQDFLTVKEFKIAEQIGNNPLILTTIIGGKYKELRRLLQNRECKFEERKGYVLRVFVEDYLNK